MKYTRVYFKYIPPGIYSTIFHIHSTWNILEYISHTFHLEYTRVYFKYILPGIYSSIFHIHSTWNILEYISHSFHLEYTRVYFRYIPPGIYWSIFQIHCSAAVRVYRYATLDVGESQEEQRLERGGIARQPLQPGHTHGVRGKGSRGLLPDWQPRSALRGAWTSEASRRHHLSGLSLSLSVLLSSSLLHSPHHLLLLVFFSLPDSRTLQF